MKNVFKFVLFVVFVVGIFFISNVWFLGCVFIISCVISLLLKLDFKKMCYYIKIFFPFVMFTIVINWVLDSFIYALIMGVKIMIAYIGTYVFSQTSTILDIAKTIKVLLTPFKVFGINVDNIEIMVAIAICMLPVLKGEIVTTIHSLKCKGAKVNLRNFPLIVKPLLISILRKTGEVEKTIMVKGYVE